MIKINGELVNIEKFPDGTPRINIDMEKLNNTLPTHLGHQPILIEWFYENNDELFYLILVKRHLETHFINVNFYLHLPYIPNARMDRVKSNDEVFTLKYFCEIINLLKFDSVYVLDAHSDVSTALLNNCVNNSPKKFIEEVIKELPDDIVLYFPDAGAAKRYSGLFPEIMYCYGEKQRDWKTGKILGLDVIANEQIYKLKNKPILMIDDIISYGGSLFYSAKALKDLGVGTIYAYVTHTENSILDKEKGTFIKSLEDNTVERLFTTNSLFTGNHNKITTMEV